LAERVQGLAGPNTIVIADHVFRHEPSEPRSSLNDRAVIGVNEVQKILRIELRR
jgi:hypothetical protein